MITNEGLFDHFRSARRHHTSGWARPVMAEPPTERITEQDMVNPDAYWIEDTPCVYCGKTSPRMLLVRLTDDPTEDDYADYGCIQIEAER